MNTGAKVRQSDCALKQNSDFFYSHAGSSRTFSFSPLHCSLSHCSLFTEKLFPQKWSLCHLSLRSLSISGCEIRAKYVIYFIYYYFEPKKVRFSLMTLMTNDIMTHTPAVSHPKRPRSNVRPSFLASSHLHETQPLPLAIWREMLNFAAASLPRSVSGEAGTPRRNPVSPSFRLLDAIYADAKNYDTNTLCLPRQYLPQPYG